MSFLKVWFLLFVLSVIYVAMMITGCTKPELKQNTQPSPVRVNLQLPWGHEDWSLALVKEIDSRWSDFEKAKDIELYCPKFKSLSKMDQQFAWATLFVAIVKRESGYNPKSKMTESNGDVSQGLFQLTYGNSHCPKSKSDGDLDDPFININCAVQIAADYAAKDGVVASGGYVQYGASPAKGLARYWSVLRVPDRKSKHHLAEIKSKVQALPFCKGV
jgi:hypothetical protein